MGKKSLLLVFFLALMLIPSNVFAMSSKEAANKMNNYIKNAIFNNAWKVTNSKSNSSNYDIKINFTNTNNSTFKEVINNMIIANNEEIDEDTTKLIYNRVFETLGNTSDEKSKTSEFFQYQCLEFSLKEYKNIDYKYSFRIGRIIKEEE